MIKIKSASVDWHYTLNPHRPVEYTEYETDCGGVTEIWYDEKLGCIDVCTRKGSRGRHFNLHRIEFYPKEQPANSENEWT